MNIFVILICTIGFCFLFGQLLKRSALKRLAYTRKFAHPAYFEGQTAELVEVIRNDRPLIIPWLRVESRIPASIVFGAQENLDVRGHMYHRSMFVLSPYQQITRRHKVHLTRRGAYDVGNATLTIGDTIGFAQCQREIHGSAPVLVYPRLLDEDEVPPPFKRLIGDCIVQRSLLTDPFLVSGIRPYQQGDQERDVHWAATARMQSLQVRTHDYTSDTNLLVVINSQTREDQWDDVSEHEQPIIEHAIAAAATLCVRVMRAGLAAGYATNMPLTPESRESTICLPDQSAAREEALLSSMARLQILRTRSFQRFLDEELRDLSGYDLLVLSHYDSQEIRSQLRRLQLNGNSVRLYIMHKGEVMLS